MVVGEREMEALGAREPRGSHAAHHHLDILDLLSYDVQGVEEARRSDDGRAVLVVVEHWNAHSPLALGLDVEALRSLLEINLVLLELC